MRDEVFPFASPNGIPEPVVRAQLAKVLASETFVRSGRLSAFLQFVVEEQLAGRGSNLKEQVLAEELYKKGADFEGASDPVVRVDARRLRDKLREYYADAHDDPVVIRLPKGTYVPSFTSNGLAAAVRDPSSIATPAKSDWKREWIVSLTGLALVLLGLVWKQTDRRDSHPAYGSLTPLASYAYDEGPPALSPDGNTVAFSCPGEDGSGTLDICMKAVHSEAFRRLFSTPNFEVNPSWSPDGREIAFVRPRQGVFVISHLGGPERLVLASGTHVGWTADSRHLIVRDRDMIGRFQLYKISLSSSEKHQLTHASTGLGEWTFAISPDGSRLAFVRTERPGVSDVHVTGMSGGEPRRLTDWRGSIASVVWTPDGRDVIYSARGQLWRVSADSSIPNKGAAIPNIPLQVDMLSMSAPRKDGSATLAFRVSQQRFELRIFDLEVPPVEGKLVGLPPLAPTTRTDVPGPLSPDGTQIAFASNRAAFREMDLYLMNRNGAGMPRRLTFMNADEMVVGSWSPDGSRIAFDAAIKGNTDVYVVSSNGGSPARLTIRAAIDGLPVWSMDGKFIYFTSSSGLVPEVWRIPAAGGDAEQITQGGGFQPQLSSDGRDLYYLDRPPSGPGNPRETSKLFRMPANAGPPVEIHPAIPPFYWSVSRKGVHFVEADEASYRLSLLRLDTQRVERNGEFPFTPAAGPGRLVVSQDGRWVLTSERKRDADLMMLDSFR